MPKTKGTTGNTFAALALPVLDTSDKDEIGQLRLRENIKSANEALAAANAEKSTFDKAKKTTEKHKEAILANADAQAKAIMQAARKQIEEINKKTQEEVDNLRSEDVGEERKIHNKVRVLEAQVNFLQAQLEALSPPPLSFATIRNELASAQSAPSPVHPTRMRLASSPFTALYACLGDERLPLVSYCTTSRSGSLQELPERA